MELMGQWAPSNQTANSTDGKGLGDDLGYMSFPAVKGGAGKLTDVMGGGDGLAFGKNASQEAVDFVKYMMQIENYSKLVAPLNFAPCVKGGEKYVTDKNLLMVIDQVSKAEYFQLYYDQYLPPSVGEAVKDATQGIFAGTTTPVDAAKMVDKAYKDSLK